MFSLEEHNGQSREFTLSAYTRTEESNNGHLHAGEAEKLAIG